MFTEDLTPFFSLTEFASDATLGGATVQGIFDRSYVDAGSGMGMSSTAPAFTLPTAQVPTSPVGLAMVINDVTYAVSAHEPDGTGISLLILERTA
jgi:hypothetical protein